MKNNFAPELHLDQLYIPIEPTQHVGRIVNNYNINHIGGNYAGTREVAEDEDESGDEHVEDSSKGVETLMSRMRAEKSKAMQDSVANKDDSVSLVGKEASTSTSASNPKSKTSTNYILIFLVTNDPVAITQTPSVVPKGIEGVQPELEKATKKRKRTEKKKDDSEDDEDDKKEGDPKKVPSEERGAKKKKNKKNTDSHH